MKNLFGMVVVALVLGLVGCQGSTTNSTDKAGKKAAANTTGNQDAATVFKTLDTKNDGNISLAEFQAIPMDGITNPTKKQKVADAAAREKTFNEYAKDGQMNQEQFIKCYNDLTQK